MISQKFVISFVELNNAVMDRESMISLINELGTDLEILRKEFHLIYLDGSMVVFDADDAKPWQDIWPDDLQNQSLPWPLIERPSDLNIDFLFASSCGKIAETLGMKVEELAMSLIKGLTMSDLAIEQGMDVKEVMGVVKTAHTNAV